MNNKSDTPFEPPKINDARPEPISYDEFSNLLDFSVDARPPNIKDFAIVAVVTIVTCHTARDHEA